MLAGAAFCVSCLQAQQVTLGEIARTHGVPVRLLSEQELRQPITSFAVSGPGSPFLVAYYDDDGSGRVPAVLHVIRYDERSVGVQRAELRGVPEIPDFFGGVTPIMSEECLGSVLGVFEADGLIFLDTHINPSAGCTLILDTGLHFEATVFGFRATDEPHADLVFESNTVHFAPTHSPKLEIYDVRKKDLQVLYPQPGDSRRSAFAEKLRRILPPESWCREKNMTCDPKKFTTEISHAVMDTSGASLRFTVTMTASEGFGPSVARELPDETVDYRCSKNQGKWVCSAQ